MRESTIVYRIFTLLIINLFFFDVLAIKQPCTRLDHELSYTQETAPSDVNDIVNIVTNFLNRQLRDVVRVDINYTGEHIHGMVGKQTITAEVKRYNGNSYILGCYDIVFDIKDIDECTYTGQVQRLHHNCQVPATCRNTFGSYQCDCPPGYFGLEGSGDIREEIQNGLQINNIAFGKYQQIQKVGKCGGLTSTDKCCGEQQITCQNELCTRRCKGDFVCVNDPCLTIQCGPNAHCVAKGGPKAICECDQGFIGDPYMGCQPRVKPNYCNDANCPCNCMCEQIDEKDGYVCIPKQGYSSVENSILGLPLPRDHISRGGKRLDSTSCVDVSLPEIFLNPPNPLILRQGDTYQEYGVTVNDKNGEDFPREIDFEYSKPFGEYVTEIGQEKVTYTLKTPWLPKRQLSVHRDVIVVDIDECQYTGPIDRFRHKCVPELAHCINTEGSYYCECKPGYSGDGYTTRSGCRDSVPPVIQCQGDACHVKKYTVCDCKGLFTSNGKVLGASDTVTTHWVESYLRMVPTFCDPSDEPCFIAYDETPYGTVDLTNRIEKGKLEAMPQPNPNTWQFRIPYNVIDAAGNRAQTVYQVIQVEKTKYVPNTIQSIAGPSGAEQHLYLPTPPHQYGSQQKNDYFSQQKLSQPQQQNYLPQPQQQGSFSSHLELHSNQQNNYQNAYNQPYRPFAQQQQPNANYQKPDQYYKGLTQQPQYQQQQQQQPPYQQQQQQYQQQYHQGKGYNPQQHYIDYPQTHSGYKSAQNSNDWFSYLQTNVPQWRTWLIIFLVVLFFLWLFFDSISFNLRCMLLAIQYLINPKSFAHRREDFEFAYDFILRVSSFGMMDGPTRAREIHEKRRKLFRED